MSVVHQRVNNECRGFRLGVQTQMSDSAEEVESERGGMSSVSRLSADGAYGNRTGNENLYRPTADRRRAAAGAGSEKTTGSQRQQQEAHRQQQEAHRQQQITLRQQR
ncbi:hypothetical protein F7725_014858 [Dissostichus mawsoni]|uniref:Uncharacterized protein n=1 Tax=Dissostichus mawsoni TaxID=36200 RepID=A0A7J5YHD9_DISMA|nr:hypothetical protein F7725_014858 [Dissostichus mawsoni]